MICFRVARLGVATLLLAAVLVLAPVLFLERPVLLLQQLVGHPQSWLIDAINPSNAKGYERVSIPARLQEQLSAFALQAASGTEYSGEGRALGPGGLEDYIIWGPTRFTRLPMWLSQLAATELQPLLEEFCACSLAPAPLVHGLRIYRPGATLSAHLDWPHKWVVSATICVARNGSQPPWPVELQGRGIHGTAHVSLEAGEALLYEGSRLWHGRPRPLQGGDYHGLFVGFVPLEYPAAAGPVTRAVVRLTRRVQDRATKLLS